jgi:phosphatidylserine/phosphatidylglycerophosphate/cardiolipin synthase-like enzyme
MAALSTLLAVPSQERIEIHFAPSGVRRLLEERISAEIERARDEVVVAMFHFTSGRIVDALAARRRAGVRVAVLLDASQAEEGFIGRLRDLGMEVRRVTPRGDERARFHHKYAVLDGKGVVTGSYNWTVGADMSNHDNIVLLRDAGAARAFREDFERTWNDRELSHP